MHQFSTRLRTNESLGVCDRVSRKYILSESAEERSIVLGAESEKGLKPGCFFMCPSSTLGMCKRDSEEERRDLAGAWRRVSSWRYSGA